jgi:hypothetical protein
MSAPVPAPVNDVVNAIFGNKGKTLEKVGLYVVGILTATNVIPASTSYKEWIVGAIAIVLHGLHTSTPTPKSGPGQL